MSNPEDGTARSGRYCKLHLFVVAQTEHGQTVKASGSSLVMGGNNYAKAVPLFTTPTEYPVWRTLKPILVPRGTEHTYEYAVFNGGKIQRWEGVTRTVNAVLEEIVMEDEFGLSHEEQLVQNASFGSVGGQSFNSTNSITNTSQTSDEGNSSFDTLQERAKLEAERVAERFKQEAATLLAGSDTPLANIMQGRSLVLACFHLPVELKRNPSTGGWTAQWNDSLIARSDNSIAGDVPTTWIGTINAGRERVLTPADKMSIKKALVPMSCVPIFADNDLVDKAYFGFCKQHLWPSFHNVDMLDLTNACWNVEASQESPELSWDLSAVQGHWEAYHQLNATFAAEVAKVVGATEAGCVLWVHDYHLMLLPQMLKEQEKSTAAAAAAAANNQQAPSAAAAPPFGVWTGGGVGVGVGVGAPPVVAPPKKAIPTKVAFFLHIPFSTSQIFRSLQHGNELLRGMLFSDVVGFHAFDHARHFLVACKRILGLKFQTRSGGMLGVEFEGRTVSVVMRHVSIEVVKIDRKMAECGGQSEALKLKEKHSHKRLIGGLDTCQRLSGVALKLLGFERLLDEYDKWRDQAVLVQRCFKPRNRHDDEDRTSRELNLLVERINNKYPGSVDYEEVEGSRLTSGKRFGLWLACDVLLNTSVREGLNLDCFEYVYVRKEDPGVIVASEFSTTVSVLNGALRINPFDIKSWKSTLDQALSMPFHDRAARKQRDIKYVTSRPSPVWTKQILNDMMMADAAEQTEAAVIFTDDSSSGTTGSVYNTGTSFSKLEPSLVCEAYAATNRRVFIFDYSGTLMYNEAVGKYIKDDINPCHKGRRLPESTVKALRMLSEDPRNVVYIISSLAQGPLQDAVSELPLVGLAAQNGLCYCLASGMQAAAMAIMAHGGSAAGGSEGGGEGGVGSAATRSDSFGVLKNIIGDEAAAASSAQRAAAAAASNSSLNSASNNSLNNSSSNKLSAFPLSDQNLLYKNTAASGGNHASSGRTWFVPDFGVDWEQIKAIALPILNRFTGRTNGASIRFREPTVAWSYYRCDPEWGIMQAAQLTKELEVALSPFNVQVQHDGGEVQIVPKYMHKGTFVKRVLQLSAEANNGLPPDLVFVIGDSVSDEKMFSSVLSFVAGTAATPSASETFQTMARQRLGQDTFGNAARGEEVEMPEAAGGGGGSSMEVDGVGEEQRSSLDEDPLSAAVAAALEEVRSPLMPFGNDGAQGGVGTGERAGYVETRVFTCTVGKKPSSAGCYVGDVKGVEDFLSEITKTLAPSQPLFGTSPRAAVDP